MASTRESTKKKKKDNGTPMAQKVDIDVGDDVPVLMLSLMVRQSLMHTLMDVHLLT